MSKFKRIVCLFLVFTSLTILSSCSSVSEEDKTAIISELTSGEWGKFRDDGYSYYEFKEDGTATSTTIGEYLNGDYYFEFMFFYDYEVEKDEIVFTYTGFMDENGVQGYDEVKKDTLSYTFVDGKLILSVPAGNYYKDDWSSKIDE